MILPRKKKGGIFWDAGQVFVSKIMTWIYAHLMQEKNRDFD